MSLLQELKLQASVLDHVSWQEATPRVVGLLKWMREQPEIKNVLDDLKNNGPVFERLCIGGPTARREAATLATGMREVAAVGLAMAELCSAPDRRDALHQIATSFGVHHPGNLYDPADFLANEAIKLYIKPLLNYVIAHLPENPPAAVGVNREQLTFELLKALYDEYERDPLPTHWVKLDTIWEGVTGKYGDSISSELADSAFQHLYAGKLINQVSGPGNARNIQINERGLAVFHEMKASHSSSAPSQTSDPRTVFVVHGRNEAARKSMFDFLRAIGLQPLEWSQATSATGEATPYVGQILDAAFAKAQAIVVLMTPDDEALLKKELQTDRDADYEKRSTGQARPNVLFEAGMAFGRHPKRTVLVELGTLRPFSDVGGRHVLRLNNSSERRQDLAERLRTAGCSVDLSGTDWHTTGSFDVKAAGVSLGPPEPEEGVLEHEEIEVLKVFSAVGDDGTQKQNVAERLKLHPLKADSLLDRLMRRDFLHNLTKMGEPTSWYRLAPKGRDYLVENKFI